MDTMEAKIITFIQIAYLDDRTDIIQFRFTFCILMWLIQS